MTTSELKILQDAADGRVYKETAAMLKTSEARVKNLASALFRKLQVNTKSSAVAVAFRRGLIQ